MTVSVYHPEASTRRYVVTNPYDYRQIFWVVLHNITVSLQLSSAWVFVCSFLSVRRPFSASAAKNCLSLSSHAESCVHAICAMMPLLMICLHRFVHGTSLVQ